MHEKTEARLLLARMGIRNQTGFALPADRTKAENKIMTMCAVTLFPALDVRPRGAASLRCTEACTHLLTVPRSRPWQGGTRRSPETGAESGAKAARVAEQAVGLGKQSVQTRAGPPGRPEGWTHRRNAQPQAETCSDRPTSPGRKTKGQTAPSCLAAPRQGSGQLRNVDTTAGRSQRPGAAQGDQMHRAAGNTTQNGE